MTRLGATWASNGDSYERSALAAGLLHDFARCEEFWARFILPLRKSPNAYVARDGVDPELQVLCQHHYTLFRHLLTARSKHGGLATVSQDGVDGLFGDIYFRLGAAVDNAEQLFFRILKIQSRLGLATSEIPLSQAEILDKAGSYAQNSYAESHERFVEEGRTCSLRLHTVQDVLSQRLAGCKPLARFREMAAQVREYRNATAHRTLLGMVNNKVPKRDKIAKYRLWQDVINAASDGHRLQSDFASVQEVTGADIRELSRVLNELWACAIDEMNKIVEHADYAKLSGQE